MMDFQRTQIKASSYVLRILRLKTKHPSRTETVRQRKDTLSHRPDATYQEPNDDEFSKVIAQSFVIRPSDLTS